MKDFIASYDTVDANDCDSIVDLFENSDYVTYGEYPSETGRKDQVLYSPHILPDIASICHKHLTTAMERYTDEFSILKRQDLVSSVAKIQKTKPSEGFHHWHCERGSETYATRVLTWTIYLNDVEDGGETEFLYIPKRVKPRKGRICIFPADFTHTHRGNQPLTGEKYIATGWLDLLPDMPSPMNSNYVRLSDERK